MSTQNGDWTTTFEANYTSRAQANARRRARERRKRTEPPDAARPAAATARLKARHAAEVLTHMPDAPWQGYIEIMRDCDPDAALIYRSQCAPLWEEQRAIKRTGRKAAIKSRGTGLISDEHPILKLFVSKLPRARTLMSGDNKAVLQLAPFGSKLLGCDDAYVEANKSLRGIIRVEIDRNCTWQNIESACELSGAPLPNIGVGFCADNTILNPHLLWCLDDSVVFTERGRRPAQILFRQVLHELTAALRPYGADAGGVMNCMRVKNPLSPCWAHHLWATEPYRLEQLRVATSASIGVDVGVSPLTADHPDPDIAVSSNSYFRHLTTWARENIHRARIDGRDEPAWRRMVEDAAADMAETMTGERVERRGRKLAGRVARWTWTHVKDKPVNHAPGKSERTQASIRAAVLQLRDEGKPVTQMAVVSIVQRGQKCGLKTIKRHWPVVS